VPGVLGVEVRRCNSPALLDSAYRLRYRAYAADGSIQVRADGRFADRFDAQVGTQVFIARTNGAEVGTIRVVQRRKGEPLERLECAKVYGSELLAAVGNDHCAEVNRFSIAPECQGFQSSGIKLALLKAVLVALVHERPRFCLAAVREDLERFYIQALGMAPIGPRVPYPGLSFSTRLLASELDVALANLDQRVPILAPKQEEVEEWTQRSCMYL